MKKKGIVLLSGGLDSATTAASAVRQGFDLTAVTFIYNQRHDIELVSAEKIAAYLQLKEHIIIEIPSVIFTSSLIKNSDLDVPLDREDLSGGVPSTYVPARNILFLSYALALGESTGAHDIFIGANAVDYSGYPDCRPEFFDAFSAMANIGTKAGTDGKGFRIHAPLLAMTKARIIILGTELGMDFSLTHSCYNPGDGGRPCGRCDSCLLRMKGFSEAGIIDPLYR